MKNSIWTKPRPPIDRFCTLRVTCSSWPDEGKGIWKIYGYGDMETKGEYIELVRVIAPKIGDPCGEHIKIWRQSLENFDNYIRVWRGGPDLLDPRFNDLVPTPAAFGRLTSPSQPI